MTKEKQKNSKKSNGKKLDDEKLDHKELTLKVAKLVLEGLTPTKIVDKIWDEHKQKISREAPYKLLQEASANNWVVYSPPRSSYWNNQFQSQYPWLNSEVLYSKSFDDVATRAAEVALELIILIGQNSKKNKPVHVGLAGGTSVRMIVKKLAELLRRPDKRLPSQIVFQSLVAGFDEKNPKTDPNTFYTFFEDPFITFKNSSIKNDFEINPIQTEVKFIALHSPSIVTKDMRKDLFQLTQIKNAMNEVKNVDLVITAAGSIEDEHGMICKHYRRDDLKKLKSKETDCIGDMLWQPISSKGPIDTKDFLEESMTLLKLNELPNLIERGLYVLLALGPCKACNRAKDDILQTILDLKNSLVTHVIVDHLTIQKLLNNLD